MRNCRQSSLAAALVVASTVGTAAMAAERPEGWTVRISRSKMDDQDRWFAIAFASQPVEGRGQRPPSISLRCQNGKTELFADSTLILDSLRSSASIRIRFDEQPAERATGSLSTDHQAFFFREAHKWVPRLSAAKRVLVEFDPYNRAPVVAEFTVTGLEQHSDAISKHCGVRLPDRAPASAEAAPKAE